MLAQHAGTPANISRRASAMRRQRRRTTNRNPLYCATNGCASFLSLDQSTGIARCAICGYSRQVH
jgi:hypothetical protein